MQYGRWRPMLRQASTLFSRHGGGERTLVNFIEERLSSVNHSWLIVCISLSFYGATTVVWPPSGLCVRIVTHRPAALVPAESRGSICNQLSLPLICTLQYFKNTIFWEENYRLIFDHSFKPNNQNKDRTKWSKINKYIYLNVKDETVQ